MEPPHEIEEIDAIYDALERGDPQRALAVARRGLAGAPDDPVLHFLAGNALLELDLLDDAVDALDRAVKLDPDDGEFRVVLARALYHCGRVTEAATHARRALRADEDSADAHEVVGLLLEADGRFDDADRHLERAARLDPEAFPAPLRLERDDFDRVVRAAGGRLPSPFRERLQEVTVSVEPVPDVQLREAEQPPLDPGLLGLFVGVSLPERSYLSPGGELPPRIFLFQRNLERGARDREELEREIAVTLYHELGHYLGLDEDELAEIDLD